jgi:hypothetical protein
MLKDLLSFEEKNMICSKHFKALTFFGVLFNKQKPKEQHKFVFPLKKAGFSRKEAKFLKFKANKKMWLNCLNQIERNKGGRPKMCNLLINKLNNHLKENSSIAANRYLKRQKAYVMNRNMTKITAYNSFEYNKLMCFKTFRKYSELRFKKPHRVRILMLFKHLDFYCQYF